MTWPECRAIGPCEPCGPCVSKRTSSSMVPTYARRATSAPHRRAVRGTAAGDRPGAARGAAVVAHNRNKALVAFLISVPVLFYLGRTEIGRQLLLEKAHEYVGFIVVIGALFMITGGIHIEGSLAGTPLVNTAMLAIGAVLSNLLGTTGASVLLIRPLLRANQRRKRVAHIVIFFIFIVGNCGGLLTPIGDR